MPTDRRPAELDDLDRIEMAEMSGEEFARRADALREVIRERWVSEANVAAMQEQERRAANERKVTRLAFLWVFGCLTFAGVAWYLGRMGL